MAITAPKATAKREPDPAPEVAPSAPKKKSRFLKLALVMLLLGGIGAAAWYFLRSQDQDPVLAKSGAGKGLVAKAVSSKPVAPKPPVFVALEPFTVNLMHEDNQSQYLQIGLSLKLTDSSFGDVIKVYLPEIRSRMLLLLASKRASEISTSEGKKMLVEELAREIVQPLPANSSANMLEGVLFTSFVIQ